MMCASVLEYIPAAHAKLKAPVNTSTCYNSSDFFLRQNTRARKLKRFLILLILYVINLHKIQSITVLACKRFIKCTDWEQGVTINLSQLFLSGKSSEFWFCTFSGPTTLFRSYLPLIDVLWETSFNRRVKCEIFAKKIFFFLIKFKKSGPDDFIDKVRGTLFFTFFNMACERIVPQVWIDNWFNMFQKQIGESF